MRRSKIPQKASQKLFTKTAQRVHPRNTVLPMRGGIRT